MADQFVPPTRYAPAIPLPPYSYVPGHGLPHPVNDPGGHLYATRDSACETSAFGELLASLSEEPIDRRHALAAALATNPQWLFAIDLFNAGFYWEAHEAWEAFWHAFGRTTAEAKVVQALIHLTAAGVKIREGKPAGVQSHNERARALLAQAGAASDGGGNPGRSGILGLASASIAAVCAELDDYQPECWQTSRSAVVKVLVAGLRPAS
jgi:uncharacterized protein